MNNIKIVSFCDTSGNRNKSFFLCKERLELLGWNTELIEGYRFHELVEENPKYRKNYLVFDNAKDKVLPALEKSDKGIMFCEDDVIPRSIFTPEFVESKIKEYDGENNVLWFGFQRVVKNKTCRSGYWYVGSHMIWIPRSLHSLVKNVMEKSRKQHYDGFLSKNKEIPIKVVDVELQMTKPYAENRYVNELEGNSITIGYRKGLSISDVNKY
jgi:hypothetical protein